MLMQTESPAAIRLQLLAGILEALGDEYEVAEERGEDTNEYLQSIQSHFNVMHTSGDGRGMHFSFDCYQAKHQESEVA